MDEKNRNLVEIAKKKRYIAIVEKLGRGSLSSKELKELEEFEKAEQRPLDGVIDGTVALPNSVRVSREVPAHDPAVRPAGHVGHQRCGR